MPAKTFFQYFIARIRSALGIEGVGYTTLHHINTHLHAIASTLVRYLPSNWTRQLQQRLNIPKSKGRPIRERICWSVTRAPLLSLDKIVSCSNCSKPIRPSPECRSISHSDKWTSIHRWPLIHIRPSFNSLNTLLKHLMRWQCPVTKACANKMKIQKLGGPFL